MERKLFPLLFFILVLQQTICVKAENNKIQFQGSNCTGKPVATGFTGQVLYVSATNDTLIYVFPENNSASIFLTTYNFNTSKWSEGVQMIFNNQISFDNIRKTSEVKELFVPVKNKKGKWDIYCFQYCNGVCGELEKLNDNINTAFNEKSASLSEDENTLYFASDRKGGKGGYDIYKSERLENGEWGPAQNLGSVVNTKADEDSPFILSDNVTLYFSSLAHGSLGGFDIFNSTLSEDGIWSVPESAGTSINSKSNDLYYYLTADEKILFYSSSVSDNLQQALNIYEIRNSQQEFTIKIQ